MMQNEQRHKRQFTITLTEAEYEVMRDTIAQLVTLVLSARELLAPLSDCDSQVREWLGEARQVGENP